MALNVWIFQQRPIRGFKKKPGQDPDFAVLVEHVAQKYPKARLFAVGLSAGVWRCGGPCQDFIWLNSQHINFAVFFHP